MTKKDEKWSFLTILGHFWIRSGPKLPETSKPVMGSLKRGTREGSKMTKMAILAFGRVADVYIVIIVTNNDMLTLKLHTLCKKGQILVFFRI